MDWSKFNAEDEPETMPNMPIPEGVYSVIITDAEMKETKKNYTEDEQERMGQKKAEYLSVSYQITEGEH